MSLPVLVAAERLVGIEGRRLRPGDGPLRGWAARSPAGLARAGHRKRPEMRDLIKKLPKLRGHGKNRARTVRVKAPYAAVNLSALEANFAAGDLVNPETLYKKGLVGARGGRVSYVKILGTGSLGKALKVSDCAASATAKTAIEAAGGSILA